MKFLLAWVSGPLVIFWLLQCRFHSTNKNWLNENLFPTKFKAMIRDIVDKGKNTVHIFVVIIMSSY
jgi:hypothetical protein